MISIPRIEQKLELNNNEYFEITKWLKIINAKSLFTPRIICSNYFDTLDFKIYNDTNEGIIPRKKIRIRTYNTRDFFDSSNPYNLEIKITYADKRLKSITKNIKLENLINQGYYDSEYGTCFQQIEVSYIREYYYFENLRFTLDREINYRFTGLGKALINKNIEDKKFVFEIKAPITTSLDYILKKIDFPRSSFSKYERGINFLFDY